MLKEINYPGRMKIVSKKHTQEFWIPRYYSLGLLSTELISRLYIVISSRTLE